MFKRAAGRAFQRVANPQPNSLLRCITHVAPKNLQRLDITQSNPVPHARITNWPVNLNEDLLALDQAYRPPIEVPNQEKEITPVFSDPVGLSSYNPEVQATMRALYLALASNELSEIVQAFMKLKQLNTLGKFMDADVGKVSLMLAGYLLRAPKDSQRTDAEKMAVFFAIRGFLEPLHSAMAYHLLQDDPDSILELWDQYQSWKKIVIRTPRQKLYTDDRLMYVTAAAAMKDDYARAASAFRTSSSSFPPWRVSEFSGRFLQQNTPLIRQRFLDFLHDASLARDIEHFGPLVTQVAEIGRLADHTALLELYDSMRDGLERGVFAVSGTTPPSPQVQIVDPKTWSLFVWGAIQCRNPPLAETFMKDMERYGLTPTLDTWGVLLKGYSKKGLVENMMNTIQKIRAQGLEPNLKCLMIIMGALYDKQLLQPAAEILRTIQEYSPPPEDPDTQNHIPQLRVAYNIALNGLLRNRAISEAHRLLKKMEEEGPQPNIVTYNTILNRYTNMRHLKGVAATLRRIADRGLQPDIYTFTILYVGASRIGDEEMKTSLLKRMKALNVKPNNALLCAAINSILGSGSNDAIPTAMGLLKKMEAESDRTIKPNEITYHTIMHSVDELVLQKALDEQEGFRMVREIYRRMVSRGFRPSRVIHHSLLRMYMRRTDPESLRVALSIFDQLMKEDLATGDSWYILLNGLERRKEYAVAKHMIGVLRRSPQDARGSLLATVDRINRY